MSEGVLSLLMRPMAFITDYAFKTNVMEEIFKIRICTEILSNDIKVGTSDQYMLYITVACYKSAHVEALTLV